LLALVATRQLWVIANYKETQMTNIRPGLEVDVDVDSYPGTTFKGKVESVQSGTGARFSLLPPENAAGSFVKVVQRIPVKITFDQPPSSDTPLRPGMSVEARVRMP
jgi:membrane fusion protein (multidrug efflux system)